MRRDYVKNCYGSSDSMANAHSDGATLDTTVLLRAKDMKTIASDLGGAFADDTNNANNGYPVFKWQLERKSEPVVTTTTADIPSETTTTTTVVTTTNDTATLGKIYPPTVNDGEVTWKSVTNAVYYKVGKIVDGKTSYSGKVEETSYTFKNVPKTTYKVFVVAYGEDGSKVMSSKVTVNPKPNTIISAPTVDSNGKVTWNRVANAVYYKVAKVVNGKTSYSGKTTNTSYTFKSIPKSDYQVYVIVFYEDGSFVRSDKVTVKVTPSTKFIPTVDKNGKVTWNKVDNASYYRVAKVANGKTYYGSKTTKTTYTFKTVPNGSYKVYVIAYDANGIIKTSSKVNA